MKGNEALAALWEALDNGPRPPANSVSAEDCAKQFGISMRTARERLTKKSRAGELECGSFTVDGHAKHYYWLPEKKGKRGTKS